jgi:hypothetical protein
VVVGCLPAPTTPPAEGDVPSNGTISIASAAVTTNDTTPSLTLSSTGATYMAFSGNGTTWSSWVTYATAYSTFNITTGAGCTSGDGTKTVYVKFKNDVGESTKVYDSIVLDTVAPKLSTAVYTDVDSSGTVNKDDKITFTFNDEMDTTTVTSSNVATNLLLSDSKSYGTSPAVSWDSGLKICYVTLGTSPTIVVGTTTINPSASVKDTAGNADASTAITISGTTTTVLSSVSISRSAATTTTGGATVTLTASALSTAATTMTFSCTYTWSITSGPGSVSTGTTSTATYTPPTSGTGTAYIKVSAVKTGTTTPVKTATTTVTVSAATTPSTTADPTKLSVSARTNQAKYIDLPTGATVKVYKASSYTPDSGEIVATIDTKDVWKDCSGTLLENDYIFFTLTDSNNYTSQKYDDGQIPVKPNTAALGEIQAESKIKVTSSDAATGSSNLAANDTLKLYVGSTLYGTATVGTDMTVTTLAAGDIPRYTVTNTNGHESGYADDGKILILHEAVAGNVGASGNLNQGDTVTLTFWDKTSNVNVNITLPIRVEHLVWTNVPSSGTARLDDGAGTLKSAIDDQADVPLTATDTYRNFVDSAEKITFNISATIPIVDNVGGNQVLPWASAVAGQFDSDDF